MLSTSKIQNLLLYSLFFSLNFERWDPLRTGIDFFTTKLTTILYLLFTIFHFRFFYSARSIREYWYPVVIFFVLLTTIGFLNQSSSYNNYFNALIFFCVVLFVAQLNHAKREYQILLKGLYVFSLTSILLVIMYIIGIERESILENRITIFGNNQNELGVKFCISILVLFSVAKENLLNIGRIRFLNYLAIPVLFAFMIKTGSRVAFISLILGFVSFFLIKRQGLFLKKISILIMFSIVFYLVWMLFLSDSFLADRLIASLYEGDLSGREDRWLAVFEIILENPVLGHGETGYSTLIGPKLGYYSSPHNVILEILAYTGLLGFIFMLYFFYRICSCVYKSWKYENILLPLMLCVPILGLIISGHLLSSKYVWFIFAYIISCSYIFIANHKGNHIPI